MTLGFGRRCAGGERAARGAQRTLTVAHGSDGGGRDRAVAASAACVGVGVCAGLDAAAVSSSPAAVPLCPPTCPVHSTAEALELSVRSFVEARRMEECGVRARTPGSAPSRRDHCAQLGTSWDDELCYALTPGIKAFEHVRLRGAGLPAGWAGPRWVLRVLTQSAPPPPHTPRRSGSTACLRARQRFSSASGRWFPRATHSAASPSCSITATRLASLSHWAAAGTRCRSSR